MSEPRADRVVLVIFDGLRPDMIAGRMPNLEAFAREGVWFERARSVFPSMTRVATTSVATGCWPARHGIVGNSFHQPQILRGGAIETGQAGHLDLLDAAPGGLVHARSLGERLAEAGMRMGAAHCGSAGATRLINHRVAETGGWTFSAHGPEASRTPEMVRRAIAEIGPLPGGDIPKIAAVDYAAEVAIRYGLAADGPDVLVIWLPEPDTSYHYRGLGAPETLAAMAAADTAFGRIVDAARSGPKGPNTAIVALSDHGQITVSAHFDMEAALRADGFAAAVSPTGDDAIALTLGRSGELRLLDEDARLAAELADWLMARPETGMVFARDILAGDTPGALPMSAVHLNHPRAAHLIYVMRDENSLDKWGLPGHGWDTGGIAVGGGMHGGLNPGEISTTLIVSHPEGGRGLRSSTPCALPDLAPTVLSWLGLSHEGCEGRALMVAGEAKALETVRLLEAERTGFHQWLEVIESEGFSYVLGGGRRSGEADPC